MRNKVSELMDGELDSTDAAQIIGAIENDRDLFSDWKIYHAIGDSLRQSAIDMDISERVKNKLINEPILLSPSSRKTYSNRKQKLLSLSVAASVAALSVGWLISQSVEQPETTLKEVYMAENVGGKSASPVTVGNRPLLTFQPASAYSSPSLSVSTHYNNDPLIYRELVYERSARSPNIGISSPVEVAGEQASALTK